VSGTPKLNSLEERNKSSGGCEGLDSQAIK
jgi:hypothetical protein